MDLEDAQNRIEHLEATIEEMQESLRLHRTQHPFLEAHRELEGRVTNLGSNLTVLERTFVNDHQRLLGRLVTAEDRSIRNNIAIREIYGRPGTDAEKLDAEPRDFGVGPCGTDTRLAGAGSEPGRWFVVLSFFASKGSIPTWRPMPGVFGTVEIEHVIRTALPDGPVWLYECGEDRRIFIPDLEWWQREGEGLLKL